METFSIRPKHYLTCLWPGLSELWWRGRLSALPAAIAFAATLNVLLVAKFIYVQWLSSPLVWLACWVVGMAWAVLTFRSMRELPSLLKPREVSDQPDRFPAAQLAYLKADYASAEEALTKGLAIEPRDPPALLLLAGVYRHTGRYHAAEALLREMRRLEATERWDLEWRAESARLQWARQPTEDDPSEEGFDEATSSQESARSEDSDASDDEPVDVAGMQPAGTF